MPCSAHAPDAVQCDPTTHCKPDLRCLQCSECDPCRQSYGQAAPAGDEADGCYSTGSHLADATLCMSASRATGSALKRPASWSGMGCELQAFTFRAYSGLDVCGRGGAATSSDDERPLLVETS